MVTMDREAGNKRIVDEFRFYRANQDDMVSKYDSKVIVIKNQKVIGVYDSVTAAVTQTRKQHKPGTYWCNKLAKGTKRTLEPFIRHEWCSHSAAVSTPIQFTTIYEGLLKSNCKAL